MCYTKNLQVKEGLCKAAVKHESENRYCNLFPYDSSRVVLTGLATGDYINASWVSLGGVPEHRFILAMAPLHPDSKAEHLCVLHYNDPTPRTATAGDPIDLSIT